MKRASWLLALVLLAAAPAATVKVKDAWMREPNPGRPIGAAFMTLENPGSRAIALVGVTSDAAKRIELHEMSMKDGMMSMRQVERIAIPAKGTVQLAPGGFHLMLFDLTRKIHGGDVVQLTLRFDDGSTVRVATPVRVPEGAR